MNLNPIESDILFEFTDHVTSRGFFREKSGGGIIIAQTDYSSTKDSSELARIATVISTGPECKEVTTGMKVLITPLKWTPQFELNGKSIWKTTEEHILGIIEE
jgi:co-chaperonin GroES (HSP10)